MRLIITKRALFTFFCLLFFSTWVYGQEQLKHEKKYFVDTLRQIYWQAGKPVYIFISEHPDGKELVRLNTVQKQDMEKNANPMYFEGHGTHYIRHLDLTPKETINFNVFADGIAPTTSIELIEAPKYTSNGTVYFGKGLIVRVSAIDQMVGVKQIYQSIDKGGYIAYADSFPLNEDKPYELKFYSVDMVGNIEVPKVENFVVDITSPISSYSLDGDRLNDILSSRATISLASTDASSGVNKIYYSIDNEPDKIYTKPIALTKLTDGEHTLRYHAIDNVKNDEIVKEYPFYLDRTPPEVITTIKGDQYQNRGRVFISTRTKLQITATDNKAGVKTIVYSVDGEPEKTYSEPFPLRKSEGNHVVKYYAVDMVENTFRSEFKEEYEGRSSLNLDLVPPTLDFSYSGPKHFTRDTMFITSETDIILKAADDDAGVKAIGYKIDGTKGIIYNEANPIRVPKEGYHLIDYYGTDQVNNRNTDDFFFIVDNTGPIIDHVYSSSPIGRIMLFEKDASIDVYPRGSLLFLAASDASSGLKDIFYQIDEQKEIKYESPIKLTKKGLRTIKIRSNDPLGNETVIEEIEFFIK